jgi:hypothetical protein
MPIRIIDDVVPPVVVAAANIMIKGTPAMAPYADWIAYGLAAAGYAGAFMNFGGDFVKNLGIAALPGAVERLYALVTTPTPAPAYRPSFAAVGARQAGAPMGRMASSRQEFANIRL